MIPALVEVEKNIKNAVEHNKIKLNAKKNGCQKAAIFYNV